MIRSKIAYFPLLNRSPMISNRNWPMTSRVDFKLEMRLEIVDTANKTCSKFASARSL